MLRSFLAVLTFALALTLAVAMPREAHAEAGLASWYGPGLYGNSTASGEVLTPSTYGVAHPSLPFGTSLTICHAGACAHGVPVIDRGPYAGGRVLDLTKPVADEIGLTAVGVGRVTYSSGQTPRAAASASAAPQERERPARGHRYEWRKTTVERESASQRHTVRAVQDRPYSAPNGEYEIQSGDTLTTIALELGTSVNHLAQANGIDNPNLIYAGDVLLY
jgi:rare lipoprotein A